MTTRPLLFPAARIWLSGISGAQEIALRAQSADTAARSLAEAEPQLEKLVRSGYRTVVAFPRLLYVLYSGALMFSLP